MKKATRTLKSTTYYGLRAKVTEDERIAGIRRDYRSGLYVGTVTKRHQKKEKGRAHE